MSQLLEIRGLRVSAEDKELLHGIELTVGEGETHVLMGPNGAGKSTLGSTVMGSPEYSITGGSIIFDGADITEESADKRARRGIFLSFHSRMSMSAPSVGDYSMSEITLTWIFIFRKASIARTAAGKRTHPVLSQYAITAIWMIFRSDGGFIRVTPVAKGN